MDLHDLIDFVAQPHVRFILTALAVIAVAVAIYLRCFVLTNSERNLKSYACRYPDDKDKVSQKPL